MSRRLHRHIGIAMGAAPLRSALKGLTTGPDTLAFFTAEQIAGLTIGPVQPQPIIVSSQAQGEGLKWAGRHFLIEFSVARIPGAECSLQLIYPKFQPLQCRLAGLIVAGGLRS